MTYEVAVLAGSMQQRLSLPSDEGYESDCPDTKVFRSPVTGRQDDVMSITYGPVNVAACDGSRRARAARVVPHFYFKRK